MSRSTRKKKLRAGVEQLKEEGDVVRTGRTRCWTSPRLVQMQKLCCYANTGREQVVHKYSAALHSTTPLFSQLVLDPNVLYLAEEKMFVAILGEDVLVLDNIRDNETYQGHVAYRKYILLSQHHHLVRDNRRVSPSCCVVAICARYPSPNGIYSGYNAGNIVDMCTRYRVEK